MENYENKVDDEISLLDLFSVLIKFRKVIIFTTLLLTVVISCFVYYTSNKNKEDSYSYTIEYTVPITNNEYLNKMLNYEISTDLLMKVSSLYTIADLNKEFQIFKFDFTNPDLDENDYNSFIKKQQTEKNITFSLNTNKTAINIVIKTKNRENASPFIKSLIDRINQNYDIILQPLLENRLETLSHLIDSDVPNFDKTEVVNEFMYLDVLKKNTISVVDSNPSSFIFRESDGYGLIIYIVIFMASFFISIFLAFILNTIKNIKADEVAYSKIKSAWESGKKLFP